MVRGRKTVALKRYESRTSGRNSDTTPINGHPHHTADNPLTLPPAERQRSGWITVELNTGDGLMIPKNWWHQIQSERGTLALSCVIRLGTQGPTL